MRAPTLLIPLLAALLLAPSAPLVAQAAVPLEPGTRARVTTAFLDRKVARVVESRGASLALMFVKHDDTSLQDTVVIALPEIARLEVSRGRHSRGHGALVGAVIGAFAGAVLGFATGEDYGAAQGFSFCIDRGGTALIGGILGVPIGAFIGMLVPPGER